MISVDVICTIFHIVNTPTCYLMRPIGSATFNVTLRPTKGCDKKKLLKDSLILDLQAHVWMISAITNPQLGNQHDMEFYGHGSNVVI